MPNYNRNKGNNFVVYKKEVSNYLRYLGDINYYLSVRNIILRQSFKLKVSVRICALTIFGNDWTRK